MLQLHLSNRHFLLPTKVRLILETLRYVFTYIHIGQLICTEAIVKSWDLTLKDMGNIDYYQTTKKHYKSWIVCTYCGLYCAYRMQGPCHLWRICIYVLVNNMGLVQIMACRLFRVQSLIGHLRTNSNEIWIKIQQFAYKKLNWICILLNDGHYYRGLNVLNLLRRCGLQPNLRVVPTYYFYMWRHSGVS